MQVFCLLKRYTALNNILIDHRKIVYNSSFLTYFVSSVLSLVIKTRLSWSGSKGVFVVSGLLQKRYLFRTNLSLFDIWSRTRWLSCIQRDTCQRIAQHGTFEDTQTFEVPNLTDLVLGLEVDLTANYLGYLLRLLRIVLIRGRAWNRCWIFVWASTYISENHSISLCTATKSSLSNSWHYVVWICIFFIGSWTRGSLPRIFKPNLSWSQTRRNLVCYIFW